MLQAVSIPRVDQSPHDPTLPRAFVGDPLKWLVTVTAFVAYGSLLPFQPRAHGITEDVSQLPLGLTFFHGGLADSLTNVALFAPIGWLCFAGRSPRRGLLFLQIPLVLVTAIALSMGLEWGQTWVSSRIGSWNDVRANSLGVCVGIALSVTLSRLFHSRYAMIRDTLIRRRLELGSALLAGSLVGYHLLPFDVVRHTEDLRQSFLRAQWTLLQPHLQTANAPPMAPLIHQMSSAAWFVLLGAMIALTERKRFRSHCASMLRITLQGASVAVLIELFQLFSRVHVFDMASMVLRVLAVYFGFWVIWIAQRWSSTAFQRMIPAAAACSAIALVGCLAASRLDAVPKAAAIFLVTVQDWPLESLWRLPTSHGVVEVAEALAMFGPLTMFLCLSLGKHPTRTRCSAAIILVILLSAIVEWLRAANHAAHAFDPTEPLLAALTAWTAIHFLAMIQGFSHQGNSISHELPYRLRDRFGGKFFAPKRGARV